MTTALVASERETMLDTASSTVETPKLTWNQRLFRWVKLHPWLAALLFIAL